MILPTARKLSKPRSSSLPHFVTNTPNSISATSRHENRDHTEANRGRDKSMNTNQTTPPSGLPHAPCYVSSLTPETDAAEFPVMTWPSRDNPMVVRATLARKLETERDELAGYLCRNKTAPPVALDRLVRLVAGHIPGDGCMCSAYGESECGCPNVDWRSRREVALTSALEYCLKKLKVHHRSRAGIPETIRNTEAISDAGNNHSKLYVTRKQNRS